jgi:hypothetical protein
VDRKVMEAGGGEREAGGVVVKDRALCFSTCWVCGAEVGPRQVAPAYAWRDQLWSCTRCDVAWTLAPDRVERAGGTAA